MGKYPATVGDIEFDEKLDDPAFKKCNPEKLFTLQYYQGSKEFAYKGEKIAIIEKLEKEKISSESKTNGYITVRFLVNCEGKTGLFRVQQMNADLRETIINKELGERLLRFTKSLDGWIPKEIKGFKIGYYQYLTYKIENGKVSEVLP
ncbi:hypothetical protein HHL23_02810 [Chryseobacterium sp. RP-3-3]|uniref:TonB C-terminal domain-containing protein n=1 Tax=Chryseobacterium antibioticum TaxID=2728847 RepID=A0A7Y0FQ81_9FLAO|nr:hypothetical protein [Chryseobacterium antibioticum]NML68728.1 hypothetical protein [Chryseobacterium antibioticum]